MSFNDDNTNQYKALEKGYPPGELYKIYLINKREYTLECLRKYYMMKDMGSESQSFWFSSAVKGLYFDMEATIRRMYKKDEADKIFEQVFSVKFDDILDAFRKINQLLSDINITTLTEAKSYAARIPTKKDSLEEWES